MRYLLFLIVLAFLFNINFVSSEIVYDISWDDEDVVNGEEFIISVKVESDEDKLYDGKLWIEDKGNIISERYDPKNEIWKSGYYYINEYFSGEQKIKIRINKKYEDFEGDAYIHFKIRDKKEIKKDIKVLRKDKKEYDKKENTKKESSEKKIVEENVEVEKIEEDENSKIIDEIIDGNEIEPIILGSKINQNNKNEKIFYISKQTKILNYSIYGFTVFCVLICILIIWKKL